MPVSGRFSDFQLYVRDLVSGTTTLASINLTGTAGGNVFSGAAAFSPDGRYLAFQSRASDLVDNDFNESDLDVYVRDLQLGTTTLISTNSTDTAADAGDASQPVFSPDGTKLAYISAANNVLPTTPSGANVYLADLATGEKTLVSVDNFLFDNQVFDRVRNPVFSPDGRYIAYESELVQDRTVEILARDLQDNITILVSANRFSDETADHISDGVSNSPVFSADGETIYFASNGTILVEEETAGVSQIYARDLATKTTRVISRGLDDAVGDGDSGRPVLSPDGSVLAIQSRSTGLVADDNNARQDVFFLDTASETISLASARSQALPAEFTSTTPQNEDRRLGGMSSDGRYLVFASRSTQLVPNLVVGENVFRHDRETGTTELVNYNPDGTGGYPGHVIIGTPHISSDGRYVAYAASFSESVADLEIEVNSVHYLLVRDMDLGTLRAVNINAAGKIQGRIGGEQVISPSGRYVVFSTRDSLMPEDSDSLFDVYAYDLQQDVLKLVSSTPDGSSGNGRSGIRSGSFETPVRLFGDNDRYLVFHSQATDLLPTGGAGGNDTIYVRDLENNTTIAVAVDGDGLPVEAVEESISEDGSRVVFSTTAALVGSDDNFESDVYLRELISETNIWVSSDAVTSHGVAPQISADGQKVLFIGTDGGYEGLAMRDLEAQTTTMIFAEAVFQPMLSANGNTVIFRTSLSLTSNDTNEADDVYLYDALSQTTTLVSLNQSGTASGNRGVLHHGALVNDNGSVITYLSDSFDLVPGDVNGRSDIFAYSRDIGSGVLRGELFADTDGNGTRDEGEGPLSGWTLFLDADGSGTPNNGEIEVVTDANGQYAFLGLLPGEFTVALVDRPGFIQTAPLTNTHVVQLAEDETIDGLDFGVQQVLGDLQVQSITVPPAGEPGQELTVNWQVANSSLIDISGDWQDAVYLSTDRTLDARDILLATVAHTGGLNAGLTYDAEVTFVAPPVVPGGYFVIVQTDRRAQVAQTDRANDVHATETSVDLTVPTILLDVPLADQFSAAGQRRYFQVTPPVGRSLRIQVDSSATDGATAVYVRRGALPTPGMFDVRGQQFQPDAQTIVPQTVANSTYYILVEGQFGAASTAAFTVTADLPELAIEQISPAQGGNTGRVTVQIDGIEFSSDVVVQLVAGETAIVAERIDFRDATQLFATFNLTDQAEGFYDVQVDNGQTAVAPGAFEVVAGIEAPLDLRIVIQPIVRRGRPAPVFVEVENTGNTDLPVPLLQLSSDLALVRLAEDSGLESNSRLFLATSPDGPAGVIRAGQTIRVPLYIVPNVGNGATVKLTLSRADESQPVDLDALRQTSQPPFVSNEAWDVIWSGIVGDTGTTVAGIQSLIATGANYLGELGTSTSDPVRLMSLALQQANNSLLGPVLTGDLDLSPDVPGLSLDFGRVNLQDIQGRYRLGPLGRGWAHTWENSLSVDDLGNVYIESGGLNRLFTLQANGTYRGAPGDAAKLTLQNEIYSLREPDGTVTTYLADGKFDFIRDPQGNRVTARYDVDGLLTRLTHSSGEILTLSYNVQGRLIRVSDSAGRTAIYAYDAAHEHLISATTARGTTSYDYVASGNASTTHALASITELAGTHVFYSYDFKGRLVGIERDGGEESQAFSYSGLGRVTVTDATGAVTEYRMNDEGVVAHIRDAFGNSTSLNYDANRFPTNVIWPDGATSLFTFSSSGHMTNAVDALGNEVSATYDTQFQELTTFQDERGITTRFEVDASGNTIGILYADATQEGFAYDLQGNITTATFRDGQAIQYAYDSAGRLTTATMPDGEVRTFTYDSHGNLLTATNDGGTVDMQYDAADRLTGIDYPNGRFVGYVYDAGGRITSVNQNGFVVNYAFGSDGGLSDVTDSDGALLAHYAYDTRGNLELKQLGNGTFTTYAYDSLNQLTSMVNHAPDSSINSRFDYAYDEVGRVVSVATLEGVTSYGYDLIGQLTSVVLPDGRTILYEYNAVGDRVKVTDNGVETLYTTNNLNQYTQVGETTYTYDPDGNLATRTDSDGTTYYTFNAENQLVSIDGPNGTFVYEYDVFGNRIAETADGTRREFLIDPLGVGDVIAEYDDQGNPLGNYAIGLGLIGQFDDQAEYFFDFDALGSTTGLTDASGAYVNQYAYMPFGETEILQEAVQNSFRYVGEHGVVDRGNGLLDMRARHYDPTVGQFVSDDPIGFSGQDSNVRRYVWNNPVSFVDPTGLTGEQDVTIQSKTQVVRTTVRQANVDPNTGRVKSVTNRQMTNSEFESYKKNLVKKDPTLRKFAKGDPAANRLQRWLKFKAGAGRALGWASRAAPWVGLGLFWYGVGDHYLNALRDDFTNSVGSHDPNDIVGPAGFGSQNYVTTDQTFAYTIHYENDPLQATAPAQEVLVTHQLDQNLDWTTFELGDFGFGSAVFTVPTGLQQYQTRIDYLNEDGSPLQVDVAAGLDLETGLVTWAFRSVDPDTGALPEGVFDGFLPVNDATGRGEGFVNFILIPKQGLSSGTAINAQASIVFDLNEPVITNIFTNTIDVSAPSSSVLPLPERSLANFTVRWAGSDNLSESGVASFDIYVLIDDGPFAIWRADETATSVEFAGQFGHSYAFYSVATDNVGHREIHVPEAQAVTQITGWQNPVFAFDVDADFDVDVLDAILVIEALLTQGQHALDAQSPSPAPYIDIDGDNDIDVLDAVQLISYLLNNGPAPVPAALPASSVKNDPSSSQDNHWVRADAAATDAVMAAEAWQPSFTIDESPRAPVQSENEVTSTDVYLDDLKWASAAGAFPFQPNESRRKATGVRL